MAGIEDFVVEQIMQDFQNTPQAPPVQQPMQAPESCFMQEAKYNYGANRGMPQGAVSDPRAPQGFTIDDPAARERYAQASGQQAAAAATGGGMERAMRERDAQRFKILQGLHGLDPQIQSVILKRLGIDAGAVKSKIDQQKEVLKYKQELEAPQQEAQNAIRMLLATQGGQKNAAELAMKERAQQQEAASRGQTHNRQLMQIMAKLIELDASGKAKEIFGPALMQMFQAEGINLAPQKPVASAGGRAGIKITRE